MSYKQLLDKTADELKEQLLIDASSIEIKTEDFGWTNHRYISDLFRIAHIERFSDKNLDVLHFTCFPNVDSPEPIFGFDTITTDKKPLAFFLDWSRSKATNSRGQIAYLLLRQVHLASLYHLPQ